LHSIDSGARLAFPKATIAETIPKKNRTKTSNPTRKIARATLRETPNLQHRPIGTNSTTPLAVTVLPHKSNPRTKHLTAEIPQKTQIRNPTTACDPILRNQIITCRLMKIPNNNPNKLRKPIEKTQADPLNTTHRMLTNRLKMQPTQAQTPTKHHRPIKTPTRNQKPQQNPARKT
jgi:hypothetical protein